MGLLKTGGDAVLGAAGVVAPAEADAPGFDDPPGLGAVACGADADLASAGADLCRAAVLCLAAAR